MFLINMLQNWSGCHISHMKTKWPTSTVKSTSTHPAASRLKASTTNSVATRAHRTLRPPTDLCKRFALRCSLPPAGCCRCCCNIIFPIFLLFYFLLLLISAVAAALWVSFVYPSTSAVLFFVHPCCLRVLQPRGCRCRVSKIAFPHHNHSVACVHFFLCIQI